MLFSANKGGPQQHSYALHKTLGALMLHLVGEHDGFPILRGPLEALLQDHDRALPIGACSNPSPSPEILKLPSTPAGALQLTLAKLRFMVTPSAQTVIDVAHLQRSEFPSVRLLYWDFAIRVELLVGSTGIDALTAALDMSRALASSRHQVQAGLEIAASRPDEAALVLRTFQALPDEPMTPDIVESLFSATLLGVLITRTTRGCSPREQLAEWARTVRESQPEEPLLAWARDVDRTLGLGALALEELVRRGQGRVDRLIGCLLCAAEVAVGPEALLHAHCWLLDLATRTFPWETARAPVVASVASLVESGWRMMSQRPFALRNPALNVPAVLTACEASTPSVAAKAARILLCAQRATSVSFDPSLRATLEGMSRPVE